MFIMKKEVKIVFILLVILFLILAVFFFTKIKNNLIGNVIDNTPISNTAACRDSDGGIYTKVKGIVNVSNKLYNDVCYTSDTVQEYYCSGTAYASDFIKCPSGYGCSNGACVLSGSCTDSDGGTNYNVKGIVNYNGYSYNDICISQSVLREEYCYYNQRQNQTYTCPVNSWCNNGACTSLNESCFLKLLINETKKVIAPATEGCNPYNNQPLIATASNSLINFPSSYAVDNNSSTSWKSQLFSSSMQSLTIKMDSSSTLYCIKGVNITANVGSSGPANVLATIEVSSEGVTWKNVGQQWLTYTSTSFTEEFTQTNSKYIRISISGSTQLIVSEISPVPGIVKPEQSIINFPLIKAENIFGDYNHLVDKYYDDSGASFVLRTYDSFGKIMNNYSLHSSRFIIAEDFSATEPKGEIIESTNGIIETIIPFDSKIKTIKVDNEGTIIDLNININSLSCRRTCKVEGETGLFENETCCSGFTPIQYGADTTRFTCTICGNKICSGYENKYNCQEDCK